jgi:hypothetical protein
MAKRNAQVPFGQDFMALVQGYGGDKGTARGAGK